MSPSESDIEALLLHDGFVRALARSLLADGHAADDVAQQAWVVALEHGARADSAPRWLAGVVRHLAGRLRRGEERRARREQERTRQGETPTAAEILEREAARTRVVQAVLALEDPYRECVLLCYFEGLPPRALARRLGLPVETVRTRLKRALALLRARLEREFGGGRACLGAALLPLARAPLAPPTGGFVPTVLAAMGTQAMVALAIAGIALLTLLVVARARSAARAAPEPAALAAHVVLQAPSADAPRAPASAPTVARRETAAADDPAPAPTAEPVGAVLARVSWSDGAPAEGIRVSVEPNWTAEGPTLLTREGLTDAAGEARVALVPAGAALVGLDRGVFEEVHVSAEAEAEIALVIPRGFDARGVVLDPEGAPVAGADVWMTRSSLGQGLVLARTDGAGRFHLRSLPRCDIGARAPGFAPSLVQRLTAGEGVELELELVLTGPGGGLAGTVLDPAGRPAAGAYVLAGLDRPLGLVRWRAFGGREIAGVPPGPITTRTDGAGRFRIDGLAPGRRLVAVRALGAGAWRGEAEVVAHATRALDVRLVPGVTLVGRVTRADGSPARASVEVGDTETVLGSATDTDSDGRFRLEDLEAGELTVRADEHRGGRARATLRGASGETLAWEARLDPGGAIRGRVLDEAGAPLAGWQLQAQDEPGGHAEPDFAGAASDAEGRFVLADLHDRPHRVELRPPDLGLFAVLVRNGVRPEGEELVLRVTRAELPSVRLAGSLVDEAGAPVSDARLALFHSRLSRWRLFHPDARGNFEIGPCPPGRWTLSVSSPSLQECPALVLGPRALGPEEVWDCGTLVLARGERLVVEVTGLAPGLEPELSVPIEGGWPVRLEREGAGRVWRSRPLAPGAHRLQVRGRGVAAAQVAFEVRRGAEPRLALALAPGIPLELRVQAPEGAPDLPPRLRIADAAGATVLADGLRLEADAAGRLQAGVYGTEVALAPGRYRVEAWLEDGPRAAAELALEPGAPAALRLELR